MSAGLWLVLLAAEGRPLFYWGARPPVVEAAPAAGESVAARVASVHAAVDGSDLVLRFTFDRPVREALRLSGGAPVSGRLNALLDVDADGDRDSGLFAGASDLRTGADRRLEIGTRYLGADEAEGRAASSVEVTARLFSLARDGRRRALWQQDDSGDGRSLSWHGEAIELRVPETLLGLRPGARLILSEGEQAWDGRL
jgi:hypothetical protein